MKHLLRGASLAVTFAAAPLAFSPSQGITVSEACAQDDVKTPTNGTCCRQSDSICVTALQNIYNFYWKGDGPC